MSQISKVSGLVGAWHWLTSRLRGGGEYAPRLAMRIVMGWEFFESGLEKLHGENWFADIQDKFPFPFNHIPANLSWGMATWMELGGAVLIWVGLGTRLAAFSLLVLTFVASAAVHLPDSWEMWTDLLKGYAITDKGYGNYKLPLLFTIMLVPLVFNGAGKLSLDHLIALWFKADSTRTPVTDAYSGALTALVLGIPCLMAFPWVGVAWLVLAFVFLLMGRFTSSRQT